MRPERPLFAASHLSMLSHPDVTAAAIRTAARTIR
jgi:hypothetical protein